MGFILNKIARKLDIMILLLLLIFMAISIFVVYSATLTHPDLAGHHIKMLQFYAVGFAVMFGLLFLNYKTILRFAPFYYLVGVGLLVFLYYKGDTINNSQGWFSLPGGYSFQPAELCKLLLILILAYYLTKRDVETLGLFRDVTPMGIITLIPFVLVLMQPDLGNSIGYIVILGVMCWIGHLRYSHAIIGVLLIGAICGTALYSYVQNHEEVKQFMASKNKAYWLDRIDAVVLPEKASEKATYHMKRAVTAIGSGSLLGEGYLQGTSTHSGHVPYTYSDSIFVVIGEEFGFLGSSALLMLYLLLMYRMMIVAQNLTTKSGVYIISGISAMLLFQIFENIGMLLGLMPITGITLPFISYGGTSLLINMVSIGLVLNIKIYDDM